MKTRQTGFTMIELIVVIVILGILAAVAIPKFIDMRAEAEQGAVAGVAGAAGSAMTLNYGGCALLNNKPTTNKCVTVTSCIGTGITGVGALLQGGLPTGYTAAALVTATDLGTANGNTATCVVTKTAGGYTANFAGIAAGNP